MTAAAQRGAAVPDSHPDAKLFPLMSYDELQVLAADIAENGLLEPICRYEGKILDGRNRVRACIIAGVEPVFYDIDIHGQRPIEYVLSKNLRRRHLTTIQLALLALDIVPYYTEAALVRKRVGRGGMSEEQEAERGKTAERVGGIIGVSADTVRRMIAIDKRDPEIIELMRRGAFKSVREASIAAGLVVSWSSSGPRPATEDLWDETFSPVATYLRDWLGRQLDIDERTRINRLRQVRLLQRGLADLEAQLSDRSTSLAA
jgi:ParB-like chromosome segregation protein Spo0J